MYTSAVTLGMDTADGGGESVSGGNHRPHVGGGMSSQGDVPVL
jgi:hypothetical protein